MCDLLASFLMADTAFLAAAIHASDAAEISLIAPGGIRAPLEKLVPAFERATGNTVAMTFASGGATKDRVVRGEPRQVRGRRRAPAARPQDRHLDTGRGQAAPAGRGVDLEPQCRQRRRR